MPQKDPMVQLSTDTLQEYSSARSKWAKQATEDNEFRNGLLWKDDHVKTLRERAQEPVVVNVVVMSYTVFTSFISSPES